MIAELGALFRKHETLFFVLLVAALAIGAVLGANYAARRDDEKLSRKARCVELGGTWVKSDAWLSSDGRCVFPDKRFR